MDKKHFEQLKKESIEDIQAKIAIETTFIKEMTAAKNTKAAQKAMDNLHKANEKYTTELKKKLLAKLLEKILTDLKK